LPRYTPPWLGEIGPQFKYHQIWKEPPAGWLNHATMCRRLSKAHGIYATSAYDLTSRLIGTQTKVNRISARPKFWATAVDGWKYSCVAGQVFPPSTTDCPSVWRTETKPKVPKSGEMLPIRCWMEYRVSNGVDTSMIRIWSESAFGCHHRRTNPSATSIL